MPLTVLDSITMPGHPVNEDAIGATPAAAWVIDGTSGPFGRSLLPGPSNAAWLVRTLNDALAVQFAAPRADPPVLLADVAAQIAAAYAASALGPAPAHEQPSACLALVARDRQGGLHLFNVGDCRLLFGRQGAVSGFGTSGIERLEGALVAEMVRLRREAPARDPRPALRAILRQNFATAMNRPGGYWVVHPTMPWVAAVQHLRVPAGEADHLMLMSDGLFRLVDVFGAFDEATLFAAALDGRGLAGLHAELRRYEAGDPECQRHPRFGATDDASALLLRVSA